MNLRDGRAVIADGRAVERHLGRIGVAAFLASPTEYQVLRHCVTASLHRRFDGLSAPAAQGERFADGSADSLFGVVPTFRAEPGKGLDPRTGEPAPESKAALQFGPGLVHGDAAAVFAQRLPDGRDLVRGMLVEVREPASQRGIGQRADSGGLPGALGCIDPQTNESLSGRVPDSRKTAEQNGDTSPAANGVASLAQLCSARFPT